MKQKCKLPRRENIYCRLVSSLQTIIYYHNLYSWQKNNLQRRQGPCTHLSSVLAAAHYLSKMWAQAPPTLALGQQLLSALCHFQEKVGMGQS